MATLRPGAWLALLVLFCASAQGCGDRATELRDLDGREFLSESVEGRTLVAGTQIRLRFADGELSVSAGCNSMSGSYQIDDDVLIMHGVGGTEIGCDAERHAQDEWLTALLVGRPAIELDGARLTLRDGGVTVILLDREMASPDRPLVGTLWKGNGFGDDQAVTFAPGGDAVSLRLNAGANRSLEIFTGCRNGNGRFTADDETIEIEGLAYDQVTCSGPTGTVDMAVTQVLDGSPLAYEIEERSLTLRKGVRMLLFRSAE